MRFAEHAGFYGRTVWEWNLPAGYTCPGARDCISTVDPKTGTFDPKSKFRCYAAVAERYPSVRKTRWENYRAIKDLDRRGMAEALSKALPKATHIRIHGSGDFFREDYFLAWLDVCRGNPDIHFWAFTKMPHFWVKHRQAVPSNLVLQASCGGRFDHLIEEHGLKYARVFPTWRAAIDSGLPIDTNDFHAMQGGSPFALVDNYGPGITYAEKIEAVAKRIRDGEDYDDLKPSPFQVSRARL